MPEVVVVFVAQIGDGKAVVVVEGVPYSHVLELGYARHSGLPLHMTILFVFVTVVSSEEVTTWPSTVAAVMYITRLQSV